VRLPWPIACLLLLGMLSVLVSQRSAAEEGQQEDGTPPPPVAEGAEDDQEPPQPSAVVTDIEAYVTAPLRWSGMDWLLFGGAVGAVALAHQYDSEVRTQFTHNSPSYLSPNQDNFDLQDAAPATALLVGTWGAALLTGNRYGHDEAWAMLEATALSAATTYVLKFAAGREAPDQTTDPDLWHQGGSSFPSIHSTYAFAVGTVMAESGSDDYRWLRRLLGYGVGVLTSYERLKHNQHWLSDTVAGAAIGAAAARFSMGRRYPQEGNTDADGASRAAAVSIVPLPGGGLMLSYCKEL
jgi:membrane-associated phospholipid phosphatase